MSKRFTTAGAASSGWRVHTQSEPVASSTIIPAAMALVMGPRNGTAFRLPGGTRAISPVE